MSIYNLKSIEPNRFAMAKFSEDFEVEAVYELEPGAHHGYSCTCPAGSRKVRIKPCKHVKMMTVMMGAVNTDRFYDPVTGQWSQPLATIEDAMQEIEEGNYEELYRNELQEPEELGQGMIQAGAETDRMENSTHIEEVAAPAPAAPTFKRRF